MTGFPDLRPFMADIARRLLGPENRELSSRRQLRYGNRGSLAIEIGGAKRGAWYDHENGYGGGPWQLLIVKAGMSPRAAVEWLRREIGIPFDDRRGERGR